MPLVKKTLTHEELSNKVENLAASLTGMLIDYTVNLCYLLPRKQAHLEERADHVLSILDEIEHAYKPQELPFLGALTGCAKYFQGYHCPNGAIIFSGSRYHEDDVTTALKKYKSPYLGGFEYDHPVKTVSMRPGQDFLDERAQQFADAKGLGLMRFGRVSVMRSKETGSGIDEIILTRWAVIESPEKYLHCVAGVTAPRPPVATEEEITRAMGMMDGVPWARELTNELMRALDVSETRLIPLYG